MAVPFTVSIVAVFVPGVGENAFYLWWLGPPAIGLLLTLRRKWRDRRRLAVARPQDDARSV